MIDLKIFLMPFFCVLKNLECDQNSQKKADKMLFAVSTIIFISWGGGLTEDL